MAEPRNIGLFGGTFDPVHLGHLHLAALARETLGLHEVRFLPCRISPHKPGRAPASGDQRLEMLRLATAGLPWAVADDFELQRRAPSYSYQTAEAMASRFPAARLFWIMGGDQWAALPTWRFPVRLARCVEFAVLARGAVPQPREGYRLVVIEGNHPASATVIRKAISAGKLPDWLDPAVAEWIEKQQLYR